MKKQRNLKKFLVLPLLILLVLGSAVVTFAYWGGLIFQSQETEQTVKVGQGREATVTSSVSHSLNSGEVLVPAGKKDNSSNPSLSVESVVFTYTVNWDDNLNGLVNGSLVIVIDNVKIGGDTTYSGLVNFTINPTSPTTINVNSSVSIDITVTLTEPASQTVYDAVKNKDITFDVTFSVNPN